MLSSKSAQFLEYMDLRTRTTSTKNKKAIANVKVRARQQYVYEGC